MSEATTTDVAEELDTTLDGNDVKDVINRVSRDIDREYDDPGFVDAQHRADFEAALAALRIAEGNAPDAQSRTADEVTTGRTTRSYEASTVKSLRKRVRRRDPGDAFGHGLLIRDNDRHISTSE